MQAIEFEATAHDHFIRIPDTAPDGVPLRVILSVDEPVEKISTADDGWKTLLSSMPDVAADSEFLRQREEAQEWQNLMLAQLKSFADWDNAEDEAWTKMAMNQAMRGMKDEPVLYSLDDLKERWQ